MTDNRNIELAASKHEEQGGKAFSFECGAEWSLELVLDLLKNANLNEFIIGRISYNGFGVRHCQFEFTDKFFEEINNAVRTGITTIKYESKGN